MASWLNNAIFYEIYPQSFNDTNSDGIGDFQGIINKLDYISNLGCNAIWINPCFDSSFYDAGYDVRDYYTTAERYGTNEDLHRLFDRAHEFDMHVLLDLVPGHTAIDNPWFLESGKGTRNAWTDRYIWRPMTQSPNLNSPYESIRGFLGGIAERPDAAAVNCFSTQACLNYGFGTVTEDWQFAADSPEAVQGRLLIQDIMDFWLGLGADGFRVDMAGSLVKEDPDHYWTKLLWQQVRAHLDETYPEAVLVSEWGDPEEALHAGFDMDFLLHFGPSHYLDLFRENPYFSAGSSEATGSAETAETEHDGERSECDGAGSSGCDSNGNSVVDGDNPNCNNDNVGNASGDIKAFADTYTAMLASTAGTPGYICIPSGNHDMIRMRDTLTTDEMKLAFTFLLTMPGCPFIYYGDEIGMRYMHGLKSKEGGYERTGSRTPMQWSCATNAGFSAARPDDLYLPIDADSERPNVASQTGRSDSLLETVRALNTLRLAHPALQADGAPYSTCRGPCPPLVYAQRRRRATVIAINTSDADALHAARRLRGPACARRSAGGWRRGGPADGTLFAMPAGTTIPINIIYDQGALTKSRNAPDYCGRLVQDSPCAPWRRSHRRYGGKSSCRSTRNSIAAT
ncbi:MAG: alpha-amylase family glycosyl hydrolase [Bifidobacterium pseudocatenulatum]